MVISLPRLRLNQSKILRSTSSSGVSLKALQITRASDRRLFIEMLASDRSTSGR
jgi:hypothetical protein